MYPEREMFKLLGLELFTFVEAMPMEGEVCYTNIEAVSTSFEPYHEMDISVTDEQLIVVYNGENEIARFELQDDEAFRKEMVAHLQLL